MKAVRAAIVGSGSIARAHVRALASLPGVQVVAQHSRDPARGKAFCRRHGIPDHHGRFEDLLARRDVDVLTLAVPNHLHCPFTVQAAEAGKHVIVEKPLALTLSEADRMIEAGDAAGVVIAYAEELCYLPKFVEAKRLADAGAIGDVFFAKQSEKHAGPYSPWFFKAEEAGGGILMDMGCHAIEFCRWALGKPEVKSVYCDVDRLVHRDQPLDDHIMMIIEFAGGKKALVEASWTLKGGMESKAEIHGTKGVIKADHYHEGLGLRVFSEGGETGGRGGSHPEGWTQPRWDSLWLDGYLQEMADFIRCVRGGETPLESARDGRVVLEIMIAGYLSAAEGRRIDFPFKNPGGYKAPVDIWLASGKGRGQS